MTGWLGTIGRWLDARLHARETLMPMLRHPVPRKVAGPMGWWDVFCRAPLTLLIVQILTRIGFGPGFVSAAHKTDYNPLYLEYHQPLGLVFPPLALYSRSGVI